jgi:hypothetical protein
MRHLRFVGLLLLLALAVVPREEAHLLLKVDGARGGQDGAKGENGHV